MEVNFSTNMTYFQKNLNILLLSTFLLLPFAAVHADQGNDKVLLTTSNEQNIYTAGEYLNIDSDIADDLLAAGQVLEINSPVAGDVTAAASTIDLLAPVSDDVRIAGQTIRIASQIGDHLVAFGQLIILRSSASIGGDAWIMGQSVEIRAPISGDVKIMTERLTIAAPITGNAQISAQQIIFEEEGRIAGDLMLKAPENVPTDKVGGTVTFDESKHETPRNDFQHQARELFHGFSVVMFLASLLLGAVIIFLTMPFWRSFAESARTHPFINFGIGLLFLILVPIVTIILFATLVGLPLGFVVLFVYIATLIFVGIIDGLALGAFFFPINPKTDTKHLLGAFVLGSILLFLLGLLPIIGGVLKFVIFLLAIGAVIQTKWELCKVLRKAKKI